MRGACLRAALALLFVPHADAGAALTCEQVYAVSQASVRYRDQGHALHQVLAALREVEVENKLSAIELKLLHNAVAIAYLGQASPEEIALECVQSRRLKRS